MRIDSFQNFLKHCQRFTIRIKEENIPTDLQESMLRAYIAGYISRNQYQIHLSEFHITELIS